MSENGDGQGETLRARFSAIYQTNEWGNQSGVGSAPVNNLEYSMFLQNFIRRNGITSLVDFGCGDWQFSRFIDWSGVRYLGVDLVVDLINHHKRNFSSDNIAFEAFTSLEALPDADLLVCKDVLQHLSNNRVAEYLEYFKKHYRYLLITNDIAPTGCLNQEISDGGWRTLRFDHAPFAERCAILLEWTVHSGPGWTRKGTCLFIGDG